MSTERQKQASRANGAKSRGATTPEGKLASSRNAKKHAMLSGTIVLQCESTDRFEELLATLYEEFQPQTPFEKSLIENMAVARWRQFRVWGLEKAGMDYEMRRQDEMLNSNEDSATRASIVFRTLSDDSRSLELINRYDSRYERQYYRAHRRFLEVRDRRTPPSAQPPEPMPASPVVPQSVPQVVPQVEPENVILPLEPKPAAPKKVVIAKRPRQLTANKALALKHRGYNRDYARAYKRLRTQHLALSAAGRILKRA
jgi:hypothetical protein